MAFPKFHGIQLALNSWIENFHIERLAADPLAADLPKAGRFWYNSTEGVVKYTVLNADGVTIDVKVIGDDTATLAAITQLRTDMEAEDDRLEGLISKEVTDRTAAIAALQTALNDAIAQEVIDRNAAIAVAAQNAADALATETAARIAGDEAATTRMNSIQAELDATQAGAGLGTDGAYAAPVGANFISTATSLKNATELLDTALKAEETSRIATDAALQSAINNEAQIRADADAALEQRITDYVNGQLTADETQDALEKQQRIDADAAIQAELDQTQASIGLNTDGTFAPITQSNYMNAATTVYGAAAALDLNLKRVDDALTAETAARVAADEQHTADISAEKARAEAAEAALQEELNRTQAGSGLEADGTFAAPTGSNYLNAATSLKDAALKLDSAVKAEADRAIAVENGLQSQIDAIEAASGEGAAALKTSLNNGRYTFKSTVAATSHVITHGLNAEFIQFQIMVEDTDGKFRNDIVPVEEVDANSFRIDLTVARNVKVSVQNMADIA